MIPIYNGPRVGTDRRPLARCADGHRRPWRLLAWYDGETPRLLAHAPTQAAAEHTAIRCAGIDGITGGQRDARRLTCQDGQRMRWTDADD